MDRLVFYSLWWILWLSSVVLLRFFVRDMDGIRLQPANVYYWFYGIAALSWVPLLLSSDFKKIFHVDRQFLAALLYFTVVLILSAQLGAKGGHSLKTLIALFGATVPFILLGRRSLEILDTRIMDPVFFTAVFCALGAWLLTFTGPVTVFDVTLENYLHGGDRWSFLFQEANGLAVILAAGVTALLFRYCVSSSLALKILLLAVVLPLLLFVFWKTNSRGSLLWIGIAGLCYGCLLIRNLLQYASAGSRKMILWGIAGLLGLSVLLLMFFWQELSQFLRLNQADLTTGRMPVWLVILDEFKLHPILGFGYGVTGHVTVGLPVKSPLNVFVGVLGEAGVLGLFGLLWLWTGALWRSGRYILKHVHNQDLRFHCAFVVFVMLLGMAAQQNGEWAILFATPIHFLFFFLVAAAWKLAENKNRTTGSVFPD